MSGHQITSNSLDGLLTFNWLLHDTRLLVVLARLTAAWMASSAVLMSSNSFSSSSLMVLLPHQACAICISGNADRIAFISKILKEIRLVLVWNIGALQWLVSWQSILLACPDRPETVRRTQLERNSFPVYAILLYVKEQSNVNGNLKLLKIQQDYVRRWHIDVKQIIYRLLLFKITSSSWVVSIFYSFLHTFSPCLISAIRSGPLAYSLWFWKWRFDSFTHKAYSLR